MTTEQREATPAAEMPEEGMAPVDLFTGRLLESFLGATDWISIHLGTELGYYRALHEQGTANSTELAQRTRTNERYAREWLEQQAATGIIEVADATPSAGERRYSLNAAHAEVLLNTDSLNYLAPFSGLIVKVGELMPRLVEAYRTGGGVPWTAYGAAGVEGQAALNRPFYLQMLGEVLIPSIDDVHQRLMADPPARVADIAVGGGWSAIAFARAYPKVMVEGFDIDPASVALARRNVREAGLDERVTVHQQDASDGTLAGRYDLVFIGEALHDMSRPVEALRGARALLAEGGTLLVMDENVADEFAPHAGPFERLFYGASLVLCLPTGMSEQPSAATGTVMRRSTLERYATAAGFSSVDVLPFEHPFFRVYRLNV